MKLFASKLYSLEKACEIREQCRQKNQKIVLTNGCFDLLHAGHIYSLQQAAIFGNLWVALNSDNSVKKLKGRTRPIFNEMIRAYMLSALEYVSGIFIFKDDHLSNEILSFKPDIYVKSGDYNLSKLNKNEIQALQEIKAEIHFIPFLNGFGTTSIINSLQK